MIAKTNDGLWRKKLTTLLQLVIYGVVLGSIITLGAIGVSLIFAILRFAHFAHGDVITLGAYFAFVGVSVFSLPVYLVFPFAVAATAFFAVGLDRLLYRRLRMAHSQPVIMLISSVGVALMLRSIVQVVWGPDNQIYRQGISMPYEFFGLRIKPGQLLILAGTIVLVTALHLFLTKTKMGKAMRAMADNADLARVTGINTDRVVMWTWIIAAGLAAAAGIFLGIDTRLNPIMGWRILLPVFAAAILGGIGNYYGAIAGGLVIGLAQELSTTIISPAYKPAIAFAIMVIMLVARPTGLFGGKA
jgi:branched-chain amino acid transport system permease protein/neutral amino acid transport system permease protein